MEQKRIKITIIVLSVLLALSVLALAGLLALKLFYIDRPVSVVVSDNYISEESESGKTYGGFISETPHTVKLRAFRSAAELPAKALASEKDSAGKSVSIGFHSGNSEFNQPFKVSNMFPGDSETRYFDIAVTHKGAVSVRFRAEVRPGYEKLAEVMKCRVLLFGESEPLYEGLMKDIPQVITPLPASDGGTDTLLYEISGYLDTSVGNEYQQQELIADFHWWVEEKDELAPSPNTGDDSNIVLWTVVAFLSLAFIILLIFIGFGKRKEDE